MYDAKTSVGDFLAAAAAKQPTPGGGSVSALVGALAASMGEMVLNYSVNKKDLAAFTDEMKPILAELTRARGVLTQLMIEDQLAYEAMTAARKLPEGSKERNDKFPVALLACIRVPEAMGATALAILDLCDQVINFVNPHLLSDLAICADLAMATVRCSVYNVRANMPDVTDPSDRQKVESTINHLLTSGALLIQNVVARIWTRHERDA